MASCRLVDPRIHPPEQVSPHRGLVVAARGLNRVRGGMRDRWAEQGRDRRGRRVDQAQDEGGIGGISAC